MARVLQQKKRKRKKWAKYAGDWTKRKNYGAGRGRPNIDCGKYGGPVGRGMVWRQKNFTGETAKTSV